MTTPQKARGPYTGRSLTAIESAVLTVLERGGWWKNSEIVAELGRNKRNIAIGLTCLREAGLVERDGHRYRLARGLA